MAVLGARHNQMSRVGAPGEGGHPQGVTFQGLPAKQSQSPSINHSFEYCQIRDQLKNLLPVGEFERDGVHVPYHYGGVLGTRSQLQAVIGELAEPHFVAMIIQDLWVNHTS